MDCDKKSGVCVFCYDCYYGDRCEFKCNENCMVGCNIFGDCYKCNEGFYGKICNMICLFLNCCNGCERYIGNCIDWGCNVGFWGLFCNKMCLENCGFMFCY